MSYLFDTDILSNTLKKTPSISLVQRLSRTPQAEQFTSAITVGEILYGALRSSRTTEIIARLDAEILPRVRVLAFDHRSAEDYARIRFDLEQMGMPLAEPDLRIAAIARSRGLTLVTGNIRHFERVSGLQVENWL